MNNLKAIRFWLFCWMHMKNTYYIKHIKKLTYHLIKRFINSKHFNSNTQIKGISWQIILASWTIKLGKMFFCLKPVGMPRVLLNSLWEILILLLCNKIKNWSPLVFSMTSFCLHDHGQHDFSVTFNAFRPTNPATGRSLSILAKPGVGSCDPWIVKSCQIVISWEVWRACAKHPQDTATSHQRWHFETRNEPPKLKPLHSHK